MKTYELIITADVQQVMYQYSTPKIKSAVVNGIAINVPKPEEIYLDDGNAILYNDSFTKFLIELDDNEVFDAKKLCFRSVFGVVVLDEIMYDDKRIKCQRPLY